MEYYVGLFLSGAIVFLALTLFSTICDDTTRVLLIFNTVYTVHTHLTLTGRGKEDAY